MGLTNSLYTGVSGLSTHAQMLNVSGNNIANANTPGFKGSRVTFETHILQNLGGASAPNANSGGVNPSQVGLGTRIGTILRDFRTGTIQPTGVNSDMAIDGAGFFIVEQDGKQFYTRAGNFALDRDLYLTRNGALLMGYEANQAGDILQGALTRLHIPLGETIAKATESADFAGNLNAAGEVATVGSITTSGPLYSDPGTTTPATAATALTSLYNAAGTLLFNLGDVITLSGATKGGATLPDHTFEVGAANTTGSDAFGLTLGDFLSFLDEAFGINSDVDPNAGVTINATGEIVITSNTGTVNGIAMEASNIIVNPGTTGTLPFTFTQTQNATGESTRTSFVAYDSLGNTMMINVTMVLEAKTNEGTQWRFYAESADDTDLDRMLGTGTLQFDTNGSLIGTTDTTILIDRANTGAMTPQAINLLFDGGGGTLTALADVQSQFKVEFQDGAPTGTLQDFSVNEDGTIVGIYSNSMMRVLGQVVVARFTNPQGLKELGANLFDVTANSGTAQIVIPGTSGTGNIVGGALEMSNVDLSHEFINLITAATGFSASSRVMTTSDQLIQDLLQTIR